MNQYFKKLFSGFVLKLISTVLFVVGRVLLELGFAKASAGYIVGTVMLYASLPIFYFLAIEGYKHTRCVGKYMGRLLLVGVIAELIIDFSLFGKDFSKYFTGNNLNIFLTLTMGVAMVFCLENIRHMFKNSPVGRNLFTIFAIIAFAAIAAFIKLEYGGAAIFTFAAMYLFYGNPFLILLAVAAIQIVVLGSAQEIIMYAPVIGVIFTWFYNGERGYKSLASQAFFYAIYPLVYSIIVMVIKAGL